MNRKFWLLGFLASACFFGCSEGDDKGLLPSTGCNNNGVLDAGEICDGTLFATGKRVCPEGKVLADGKTVENITCSDTCTVVTEGVCVDSVPDPTNKCNGLSVDTGEDCDGDNFAPGKRVCPVGSILAAGKTLADIKCSKTCTVVTAGVLGTWTKTKAKFVRAINLRLANAFAPRAWNLALEKLKPISVARRIA